MNHTISALTEGMITGNMHQGTLYLQSWAGFRYGHVNYKNPDPDGTVRVIVRGKEIDQLRQVTEEQINAIRFLAENDQMIRDAILAALINQLSRLKENYEGQVPDIENLADFKDHITLESLYISPSDKDHFSYTGFGFSCSWDEEHGAGVMMHKNRVVAAGRADTATDDWVTFEDNGTAEAETRKWNESDTRRRLEKEMSESKKPWWKLFFR